MIQREDWSKPENSYRKKKIQIQIQKQQFLVKTWGTYSFSRGSATRGNLVLAVNFTMYK